jgi:hypothetical protein
MFAEQGGLCAICEEAPAEHVDHDHKTNRVRGLLCFNCNGALGQFRDRVELMSRAIAYLIRDEDTSAANLPTVHFGGFIGNFESQRPADETDAA